MSTATIELPPKLIPVFAADATFRGAHGGRGSSKTRSFAKMAAIWGVKFAGEGRSGLIVCAREFMNSLDDSSMDEVKAAIRSEPWLEAFYEIGERYIRSRCGRIQFAFAGLRRNIASFKSKSRILLLWVDEAEEVPEVAWATALPTVREDGAEIWVTWNPKDQKSATHRRFRESPPDGAQIVEMNWRDNPWFPEILERLRQEDKRKRPDTYDHIWEGAFDERVERRVFRNWSEGVLQPPANVVWHYGVDWGFANDPTAALRCAVWGDTLYIDAEVQAIGCPTEKTPALLHKVPGIVDWPSRADSARPEMIDYCRRNGVPRIRKARKGKGSVEDGITFLQGFDIVVHPKCRGVIEELRSYGFKVDDNDDILPVLEPGNDHFMDALRYAVEGLHRRGKRIPDAEKQPPRDPRGDYTAAKSGDGSSWKVA